MSISPISLNPAIRYIADTCFFCYVLRGENHPFADVVKDLVAKVFNGDLNIGVSTITDYELWCGVHSSTDAKRHRALLSKFRRYQFNVSIARRAGEHYRTLRQLNMHKGVAVPDILIAATAELNDCVVLTENVKDYIHLKPCISIVQLSTGISV